MPRPPRALWLSLLLPFCSRPGPAGLLLRPSMGPARPHEPVRPAPSSTHQVSDRASPVAWEHDSTPWIDGWRGPHVLRRPPAFPDLLDLASSGVGVDPSRDLGLGGSSMLPAWLRGAGLPASSAWSCSVSRASPRPQPAALWTCDMWMGLGASCWNKCDFTHVESADTSRQAGGCRE